MQVFECEDGYPRIGGRVGASNWSFWGGALIPSRQLYRTQILDIWPNISGEDVAGLPKAASPFLTRSCAGLQDALAKAVAAEMSKQYAKAVEPVAPRLPKNAPQGMDEEEVWLL